MGTSENRNSEFASRSALNDFADDTLAISTGSLFQNGIVRMLKAYWRGEGVQHICWRNLEAWPRSPVRVGWVKMYSMGSSKRPWVIFNIDV